LKYTAARFPKQTHWNNNNNRYKGVTVIRATYELAQEEKNLFFRVSSHTLRAAATSLPRLRSNLAQYECKSNNSSTPN
jgi:hypothetical protein